MSRFSIHIVSMFSALLILVVGCFAYPPIVSAEAADDLVISSGENSEVAVGGDVPEGLLFDTMVHMLRRGASIDCSDSESGTFGDFLTSLRDDIIFTLMDYTGIDEVSWLSFNNSLNPLDWEITNTWEITRSGLDLADKYLTNRRLRFTEENSDVPDSPDPDYLTYIDLINGHSFGSVSYTNVNPQIPLTSAVGLSAFLNRSSWNNSSPNIDVGNVFLVPLFDLNFVSLEDNQYSINIPFSTFDYSYNKQANDYYFLFSHDSDYLNFNASSLVNSYTFNNSWKMNTFSRTGSLDTLLSFLSKRVRNVNIYVDGVPWSTVGTNVPVSIPVGGNTYITDTNTPVIYEYPEPAYFDYQTLYNLLETLYNNHQVIRWQDIQGVITDVDGVPVVSTVQVYRTDYDNLADEQLRFVPYFYNDQDMTEPIQNGTNIINISTSVIPDDLLVVFIWCGGVLLFALVVRRLLE